MLPLFKIILGENDEMIVNSIVDEPAHHHYFVTMNKKEILKFKIDDEKREITGVVIAANQPIYYYSDDMPECFLLFSPEVIQQIANKFFANNKNNLIDINHDFNINENAAILLESYFTDKNKPSSFDVQEGSWIATYKINDDNLWKRIKSGELKGFSIAGNFTLDKLTLNKKNMDFKAKIKALLGEAEQAMVDITTVDGKKMQVEKELAKGNKLYAIAEDGTVILAPKGDYAVVGVDKKQYTVTVDETGVIVDVVAVSEDVKQFVPKSELLSEIEKLTKKIEDLKTAHAKEIADLKQSVEAVATTLNKKASQFRKPNETENKNIKIRIV